MYALLQKRRKSIFYRALCFLIVLSFSFTLITPTQSAYAQTVPTTIFSLPPAGTLIQPTTGFIPTQIKGLTIDLENPLHFNFIVDQGDAKLQGEELRDEAMILIKYFMAALTVPEDEMWVNLSPYEENRIIPTKFGHTEMGRDLLAQDYMLKQLTASLMYPEKELGQAFWQRVYTRAQKEFGTTDIPMNTFNKIWIVPETADVYEHQQTVFVVNSHLKVMLEEDLVALHEAKGNENFAMDVLGDTQAELVTEVTSEVVREVLIPEIEREVNEGKIFANLRQIYNSMILATWYKQNLYQSLLGQIYVDQNKIKGIDLEDKKVTKKIYNQYIEAFKQGVYDYIKDEYAPLEQQIIPRKYFSGGFAPEISAAMVSLPASAIPPTQRLALLADNDDALRFDVQLVSPNNKNKSFAMNTQEQVAALVDKAVDSSSAPTGFRPEDEAMTAYMYTVKTEDEGKTLRDLVHEKGLDDLVIDQLNPSINLNNMLAVGEEVQLYRGGNVDELKDVLPGVNILFFDVDEFFAWTTSELTHMQLNRIFFGDEEMPAEFRMPEVNRKMFIRYLERGGIAVFPSGSHVNSLYARIAVDVPLHLRQQILFAHNTSKQVFGFNEAGELQEKPIIDLLQEYYEQYQIDGQEFTDKWLPIIEEAEELFMLKETSIAGMPIPEVRVDRRFSLPGRRNGSLSQVSFEFLARRKRMNEATEEGRERVYNAINSRIQRFNDAHPDVHIPFLAVGMRTMNKIPALEAFLRYRLGKMELENSSKLVHHVKFDWKAESLVSLDVSIAGIGKRDGVRELIVRGIIQDMLGGRKPRSDEVLIGEDSDKQSIEMLKGILDAEKVGAIDNPNQARALLIPAHKASHDDPEIKPFAKNIHIINGAYGPDLRGIVAFMVAQSLMAGAPSAAMSSPDDEEEEENRDGKEGEDEKKAPFRVTMSWDGEPGDDVTSGSSDSLPIILSASGGGTLDANTNIISGMRAYDHPAGDSYSGYFLREVVEAEGLDPLIIDLLNPRIDLGSVLTARDRIRLYEGDVDDLANVLPDVDVLLLNKNKFFVWPSVDLKATELEEITQEAENIGWDNINHDNNPMPAKNRISENNRKLFIKYLERGGVAVFDSGSDLNNFFLQIVAEVPRELRHRIFLAHSGGKLIDGFEKDGKIKGEPVVNLLGKHYERYNVDPKDLEAKWIPIIEEAERIFMLREGTIDGIELPKVRSDRRYGKLGYKQGDIVQVTFEFDTRRDHLSRLSPGERRQIYDAINTNIMKFNDESPEAQVPFLDVNMDVMNMIPALEAFLSYRFKESGLDNGNTLGDHLGVRAESHSFGYMDIGVKDITRREAFKALFESRVIDHLLEKELKGPNILIGEDNPNGLVSKSGAIAAAGIENGDGVRMVLIPERKATVSDAPLDRLATHLTIVNGARNPELKGITAFIIAETLLAHQTRRSSAMMSSSAATTLPIMAADQWPELPPTEELDEKTVAFIGMGDVIGTFFAEHVAAQKEAANIKVVAASQESNEEGQEIITQKKYPIDEYTEIKEYISQIDSGETPVPDAVIIVTPPETHLEYIRRFRELGVEEIVVEKPFITGSQVDTPDDVRYLEDNQEHIFSVDFFFDNPAIHWAIELLQKRNLGRIQSIEGTLTLKDIIKEDRLKWILNEEGGMGPDIIVHLLAGIEAILSLSGQSIADVTSLNPEDILMAKYNHSTIRQEHTDTYQRFKAMIGDIALQLSAGFGLPNEDFYIRFEYENGEVLEINFGTPTVSTPFVRLTDGGGQELVRQDFDKGAFKNPDLGYYGLVKKIFKIVHLKDEKVIAKLRKTMRDDLDELLAGIQREREFRFKSNILTVDFANRVKKEHRDSGEKYVRYEVGQMPVAAAMTTLPEELTVKGQKLRLVKIDRELWLDKQNLFFELLDTIEANVRWTLDDHIIGIADNPKKLDYDLSYAILNENGDPVGFSVIREHQEEEKQGVYHLSRFAVNEEFQGTVVASWLLYQTLLSVQERGNIHSVDLRTVKFDEEDVPEVQTEDRRAVAFYKKTGALPDESEYRKGVVPPLPGVEIDGIVHLDMIFKLNEDGLAKLREEFEKKLASNAMTTSDDGRSATEGSDGSLVWGDWVGPEETVSEMGGGETRSFVRIEGLDRNNGSGDVSEAMTGRTLLILFAAAALGVITLIGSGSDFDESSAVPNDQGAQPTIQPGVEGSNGQNVQPPAKPFIRDSLEFSLRQQELKERRAAEKEKENQDQAMTRDDVGIWIVSIAAAVLVVVPGIAAGLTEIFSSDTQKPSERIEQQVGELIEDAAMGAAAREKYYVRSDSETWASIASAKGISEKRLRSANSGVLHLKTGSELIIPRKVNVAGLVAVGFILLVLAVGGYIWATKDKSESKPTDSTPPKEKSDEERVIEALEDGWKETKRRWREQGDEAERKAKAEMEAEKRLSEAEEAFKKLEETQKKLEELLKQEEQPPADEKEESGESEDQAMAKEKAKDSDYDPLVGGPNRAPRTGHDIPSLLPPKFAEPRLQWQSLYPNKEDSPGKENEEEESEAMMVGSQEAVGGIDLNPELLDLRIKRDGRGIPLPIHQQPLETFEIEGFIPIIINVTPITNLPLLLGFTDEEEEGDTRVSYQLSKLDPVEYRKKYTRKLEESFVLLS